jgi:membrane AbrB-like protein
MSDARTGRSRTGDALRWLGLASLSLALAGLLSTAGLPAAFLLGPMVAGVVAALRGGALRIPRWGFVSAQGLLGCMMAGMMPVSVGGLFRAHGPAFAGGIAAVVAASGLLGWFLGRLRILPGSTVVWGLSPGAATAMIVLAEEHGADARLVAFMQYTRVFLVASTASVVAHLVGSDPARAAPAAAAVQSLPVPVVARTLAVAAAGVAASRLLRLPGGAMLLPLALGWSLSMAGFPVGLPRWMLVAAYAVVGWSIGLRFDAPLLRHALRALPAIVATTLALMACCAGIGLALSRLAGCDLLSAYLATSPGGADSVAIIASGSRVDRGVVMVMQTLRFLTVIAAGPWISRGVARLLR